MYVDLTPLFRTTISLLGDRASELGLELPGKDKGRILESSHGFTKQATKIVQTIRSLAEFLHQHRGSYVQNHAASSRQMSEAERDQVDVGADNIAKQCRNLIMKFRSDIGKEKFNVSAQEHYEGVVVGLDKYLKSVVSIHSEMRAVRVAKQIQQKKLSRLEVNSVESRAMEIGGGQGSSATDLIELREKAVAAAAEAQPLQYSAWGDESDEEMTQEESAMMEMENERLIEQLNSLNNAVDQVQSKVVKIAELQSIFTEKVLEQADDIERIHAETVSSTENIKGGNEAVRQAIQNKASYRVYILFVILVFSFSLLFLDWYND